ncbi:TPM domain-containing protein [Quisquiliibacterium transsilvanicum]|uniref:TPM domain-containing protein n=1 Tax=Quisquiliibacterium transsilvanicum TaxID=1549638 RepID=A0A7W8M8N6_9BURK|nr:uncharacterized protein [Quisquiliibacterium transsilvanicum]
MTRSGTVAFAHVRARVPAANLAAAQAGRLGGLARRWILSLLPLLALLLLHATAGAQPLQAVPQLSARVTDLTGTLDEGQRRDLEARLAAIEQRKGAQVVVLMVRSTQPETIEDYSIRVAEAWKIGRGRVDGKQVDDGVILLVAKDDRKVRIEVGYGLEGAIPDAYARRIIAEAITPRFAQGDFNGGLQAAVQSLGRLIDGEDLPAPARGAPQSAGEGDWLSGLLVVFVGGMIATAVLGRLLGSMAGGAGAGVFAALKGAPLLMAGGVGFVVFLLFLVFAASGTGGMRPGRRAGPRGGPVIWTGGGGWGGGGRGGGGGFGGGGGGFGGGGASGGW